VQTPAGAFQSTADYYSFNGYGISPMPTGLAGPNPYPNLTWPNFSTGKYPVETDGQLPPGNPLLFFDPSARPSRILHWSIGIPYVFSKAMDLGTGAATGYYVHDTPLVSDICNHGFNKQLNQLSRPLITGTLRDAKTEGR
jgi:hypothetical protein